MSPVPPADSAHNPTSRLLYLGLIEFLAGVLLVVIASEMSQTLALHDIARDVGIALLVGALLTTTFDRFIRSDEHRDIVSIVSSVRGEMETFRGELGDDFLRSQMPDSIYSVVSDTIIRRPFVRHDYRFEVTIEVQDVPDGLCTLNCFASYTVVNQSKDDATYSCVTFIERTVDEAEGLPGIERTSEIESVVVSIDDAKPQEYRGSDLNITESDTTFQSEIPISLSGGASAKVLARFKMIRNRRDQLVWVMTAMTEKLTLDVTHPDALVVRVLPLHPFAADLVVTPMTAVAGFQHLVWHHPVGFVPYQGIEMLWMPRRESVCSLEQ